MAYAFKELPLDVDGNLTLEVGVFLDRKPGESDLWYRGCVSRHIHCGFCPINGRGSAVTHRPHNVPAVRLLLEENKLVMAIPALTSTIEDATSVAKKDAKRVKSGTRTVYLPDDDPWMFASLMKILFCLHLVQSKYCYQVMHAIVLLAVKYNIVETIKPWIKEQHKDVIPTELSAFETGTFNGQTRQCLEVLKISYLTNDELALQQAPRLLMFVATPTEIRIQVPEFFKLFSQQHPQELIGRSTLSVPVCMLC
jgi:hypothetical protein